MRYFIPLLAMLFIGLKITNQIEWSWFVVLIPTYLLIIKEA